ncbi:MAG TPA: hypothetical protein VN722_01965 [Hanamia sp.]|nr:hypothetical protein [Hanamia sp.]
MKVIYFIAILAANQQKLILNKTCADISMLSVFDFVEVIPQ